MRSSFEMNSFVLQSGLAADGKACPREFSWIERRLYDGEDVIYCWTAKKLTDHEGTVIYPKICAFAITDQRLIAAGRASSRAFPLENFRELTLSKKKLLPHRTLFFKFTDGSLSFTVANAAAAELASDIGKAIDRALKL